MLRADSADSARGVEWDRRYSGRKTHLYGGERERILQNAGTTTTALVENFLKYERPGSPEEDFRLAKLRDFLMSSSVTRVLRTTTPEPPEIVIVDDRRDTSTRDWKDTDFNRPPEGENIERIHLGPRSFHERLCVDRLASGWERRIIYVANPSAGSVLALAHTTPKRYIVLFRKYLQRYISSEALFGTTYTTIFALEFHILFFALRRERTADSRAASGQYNGASSKASLRKGNLLPFGGNNNDNQMYYYEASVSLLVTGPDEWVWTSYCFADTYYNNERENVEDFENEGTNTGSERRLFSNSPVWDPRQYYLTVLSRRLMQAANEWSNLVSVLDVRLVAFQDRVLPKLTDDPEQRLIKELWLAEATVRKFKYCIERTLAAWGVFETQDLGCFHVRNCPPLANVCQGHVTDIRRSIAQLNSMVLSLEQKLACINRLFDCMVHASQLRENAATTRQGNSMALLTGMTVFYLPLSLVTAVFGMNLVPGPPTWKLWAMYVGLVTSMVFLTLVVANRRFDIRQIGSRTVGFRRQAAEVPHGQIAGASNIGQRGIRKRRI